MLPEAATNTSPSRSIDLPDHKAIAEIRLILAVAIVAAVVFTPSITRLPVPIDYAVIGAYAVSALVLFWAARQRPATVHPRRFYWLDAGWLLAIIAVTDGEPLFLLLLFPVLVAAAQSGFSQGLVVSLATAAAYVFLSGFLTGQADSASLALQAGVLIVLGFMVSRWAGAEHRLKRKLGVLNQPGSYAGVREELEPFWTETLGELATYFGAKSAFFLASEADGTHRIYQYDAGKAVWSMPLGGDEVAALTRLPEQCAVAWCSLFRAPPHGYWRALDMSTGHACGEVEAGVVRTLAHTLDESRWLCFPAHSGSRYLGRLFLTGIGPWDCRLDHEFIQQIARQVGLKWENLLLARQLAAVVATGERERISRDLHDGTVQPYLGLKYGLEALRRKIPDASPLAAEVEELVRMTEGSIVQLRGYIRDLRTVERDGTQPALTTIHAQVRQFEDYSGLKVDLRCREFTLSQGQLLEVRQLISEGLSNIRRHTAASKAALEIVVEQNALRIAFFNPVTRIAHPFTPRSLAERAAAMGGSVEVMRLATETIVKVVLPLWKEETA